MKKLIALTLTVVMAAMPLQAQVKDPKETFAEQGWAMYDRLTNYESEARENDSYENAIRLFKLAADAGNTEVYNTIAYIYMYDSQLTDAWSSMSREEYAAMVEDYLLKAIKNNSTNGYYNLASCYENMEWIGFKRDTQKAISLYRKGVVAGNVPCMLRIGDLYRDGVLDAPQGRSRGEMAFENYMRAHKKDSENADAIFRVGQCYELGNGVNADLSKAFSFYEKGAAKNHIDCLVSAGLCYETGKGTEIDLEKAYDCYNRALGPDCWTDWVIDHHNRLGRLLNKPLIDGF